MNKVRGNHGKGITSFWSSLILVDALIDDDGGGVHCDDDGGGDLCSVGKGYSDLNLKISYFLVLCFGCCLFGKFLPLLKVV